jgi:L-fuconolactonase
MPVDDATPTGHERDEPRSGLTRREIVRGVVGAGAALLGAHLLAPGASAAGTVKGQLRPGGQVATYTITYPGDKSVYTIGLQVFPDDATVLQNAGFKVFGPKADRTYVTGGAQPGLRPNVSGNLISTDPGSYTIQVYNYDPNTPIDYELSLASNRPEGEQVTGAVATPLDLGGPGAAAGGSASPGEVLVDTHLHATPLWYDRVESALLHMNEQGIRYGCLVQIGGYFNHDYQEEVMRRYPGRFLNIVQVDWTKPDAVAKLEALVAKGNVSGVRINSAGRSPGDDPFAIWKAAARLRLSITSGGNTDTFATDEFASIFAMIPDTPIVIEHLGSVNAPDGETSPWPKRRKVLELARFPNAYVKIHGLGEFAPRVSPFDETFVFQRPIPPFLDWAYDLFGPRRMMWGSDHPLVGGREGYKHALELTMGELAKRSAEDRRLIFGGTGLRVFPPR